MAIDSVNVAPGEDRRESRAHGTPSFPLGIYHNDLAREPVPWHWHPELEFSLITEGTTRVLAGLDSFVIRAGDGFFVNSGNLHSCELTAEHDCHAHSMVFDAALIGGASDSDFWHEYLLRLLRHDGFRFLHLRKEISWQAELLDHIEMAWQAVAKETSAYKFDARYHLSRAIYLLCNHLNETSCHGHYADRTSEERTKAMMRFVQQHYREKLTAGQIAASASVSESECLRCFRKLLRTTPMQYLRQFRMEKAETMLRLTSYSISEIADLCGFQDVSYFSRAFRLHFGSTPSAHRAQHPLP